VSIGVVVSPGLVFFDIAMPSVGKSDALLISVSIAMSRDGGPRNGCPYVRG